MSTTTVAVNETTEAVTVTVSEGLLPGQDAALLGSGTATSGYVLTADGVGGTDWQAVSSGVSTWDDLTGTVTSIPMNTAPATIPTTAGSVYWNADGETLEIVQDANGNSITVGGEIKVLKARNVSGVQILDGRAVYVSGEASSKPSIALASVTDVTHITSTIGIASETIASGSNGKVTTFGMVSNLDTSALTAGQPVYLQANGTYNHTVSAIRIGWVMVQSNGNGKIFVSVARMKWLSADITDASSGWVSSADDGKLLKFGTGGSIFPQSIGCDSIVGATFSFSTGDTIKQGNINGYAPTNDAMVDFYNQSDQPSFALAAYSPLNGGYHACFGSPTSIGNPGELGCYVLGSNIIDFDGTKFAKESGASLSTLTFTGTSFTFGTGSAFAFRSALGAARGMETRTTGFTAVVNGRYITEGTLTISDPTTREDASALQAGDSYEVWIGSGAATIGGTAYQPSRFSIRRRYTGSAWATPTPYLTDALDIASGARATTRANLGSGATGDAVFVAANPAAALTALGVLRVACTAQTDSITNASTTDITGMTGIPLDANSTYMVQAMFQVTAGTGGYRIELQSTQNLEPAGNVSGLGLINLPNGTVSGASCSAQSVVFAGLSLSIPSKSYSTAVLFFRTGATPGTGKFVLRQNTTPGGTASVYTESTVRITKI